MPTTTADLTEILKKTKQAIEDQSLPANQKKKEDGPGVSKETQASNGTPPKEKTKRRCKGPSDMSMPMPTNVARRAGAKIKNQREPTSCVRLIWRCFFGPQMEGWIARKPCLTPAHPSSRELNIYTK